MGLQLYDTRRRIVTPFEPITPGKVGIYVCGPTVQGAPHVGHLRVAVAFDVLRRWLTTSGYDVTLVRNVTDIDDKIIINAAEEGVTVWALAERFTRAFNAAYDALGVLAPTVEPRATGHVPEMVAMIERLIESGHAYPAAGSVWFSVRSYSGYGGLSGQRPDAVQPSPEADDGKRDPRDFALWKAAKPGEPTWETPWGPGRPGWHLECSAMAAKYLGQRFDIHGGGLDLVFPHHENERAQTVSTFCPAAAAGPGSGGDDAAEMANHWMHGGLLTTSGEKMSKSLGNFFRADQALDVVHPPALRYYLAAAHYRSGLEYSQEALREAAATYERLETFCRSAEPPIDWAESGGTEPDGVWADFAAAMDDDLSVPRALAVVFSAVSAGNKAADSERGAYVGVVRRMLAVLGLDPVSQWPDPGGDLRPALDAAMAIALDARRKAREARDYATSDAIRIQLAEAGVLVEDTAGGQRWRLG